MKQATKKAIVRKGKALFLTSAMGLVTVMTPLTFTACPNQTNDKNEIDLSDGIYDTKHYNGSGVGMGTLTGGNEIKIIKKPGVTNTQMTTILGYISNIYASTGWNSYNKNDFENGMVTEIQIVEGSELTKNGTVLKIGCQNTQSDIDEFMNDVADGIVFFQTKTNGIKLAKQFDTSKVIISISMG